MKASVPQEEEMKLKHVALAIALVSPSFAADKVKVALITKFPVPFFSTMEEAAKKYAAEHDVDLIVGQGQSATDIEGQIALRL